MTLSTRPAVWRTALAALLTLANAGCGLMAVLILIADPGSITVAAWLIFVAWLFDMMDGPVARALGAAGRFGAVLDSLSDIVSFGVAPAALVFAAGQAAGLAGPVGALIGGLYLVAAMLRLARFTSKALDDHRGGPAHRLPAFEGLPSPSAAMALAAAILAMPALPWIWAGAAVLAALLMVSRLPYLDLPKAYFGGKLPRWQPLLLLGVPFVAPVETALAALLGLYLLSGPAVWAIRRSASGQGEGP